MYFRVLGPLEAVSAGRRLVLGGARQRAVLGYLLLHAGRVVSVSDLVRALWPADAPLTARKMVQNAVSGLRGVLAGEGGDGGAELLSQAPGYVLRVGPEDIDVTWFHRLVEQGRAHALAGAWEQAAAAFGEAQGVWRGSALADLAESGVAWPELAALEQARVDALEDRFEAQLALGRHHEVARELEALLDREPARERLCSLLMLALYRSGRQVDALAAYRRLRTGLLERFGLDPGRELQELERAILTHDPVLAPQPARQADAPPVPRAQPVPAGGSRPVDGNGAAPVTGFVRRERTGRHLAVVPGNLQENGPELGILRSVLEATRCRRRPHLVTLLGSRGTGKSRLTEEFGRELRDADESVHYLVGRVAQSGPRPARGPMAQIVAAYCGIRKADQSAVAEAKLTRAVHRLAGHGRDGSRLMSCLSSLVRPRAGSPWDSQAEPLSDAEREGWRRLLGLAAEERPLVVVLEDVHRATALLDVVDDTVTAAGPVPLMVMATARPEALDDRAYSGGWKSRAATLTLELPPGAEEGRPPAASPGRAERLLSGRSAPPVRV